MLGWLADFFRLLGGLFYWNIRKTWFQQRRGRSPCPCQSPSDSGLAFETGCEACVQWSRPIRFRRVCPLLVETLDGLRRSGNTADVRLFWGRTLRYYGGMLGTLYVIAVLAVFVFLRTIGYPVSILDISLPPLWHRLAHARGWYFFEQSQRAFTAGRSAEGCFTSRTPTNSTLPTTRSGSRLRKTTSLASRPTRRSLRTADSGTSRAPQRDGVGLVPGPAGKRQLREDRRPRPRPIPHRRSVRPCLDARAPLRAAPDRR